MTNQELAIEYIDTILDEMQTAPGMWGDHSQIELQALRLLCVRAILMGGDSKKIMKHWRFGYSKQVGCLGPPLSVIADGNDEKFVGLLKEFRQKFTKNTITERVTISELDICLEAMKTESFEDDVCRREGRELKFLQKDDRVSKFSKALKGHDSPKAYVEGILDDLFLDFRNGEVFRHSEIVMGILVALNRVDREFTIEIASVLAISRSAEMFLLRKLAEQLLPPEILREIEEKMEKN